MHCLNCRYDGLAPNTEICPKCGVHLPSLMRDKLSSGAVLEGEAEAMRGAEELTETASKPKSLWQTNRRGVLLGGLGAVGLGGAWLLSQMGRRVEPIPDLDLVATPLSPAPFASPSSHRFEVVTVNATGQITNREQKTARYYTEDLGGGVTLEMVEIPAGEFMMGSIAGELDRENDESPQHRVSVPSFYIGRFAVTQAQWQKVMGTSPSGFKGEKNPVENVTWNDAQEFCKKLSQQTGRQYRLPSEAEWEYACRAGTTTPFHFGETITTDLANYDGNYTYGSGTKGVYRIKTTPVGSFPANEFGLCDMHGNVWEWCADIWHDNYNGAPINGSAWVEGGNSSFKVLRGGSWSFNPGSCRSAKRVRAIPEYLNDSLGFRLVFVSS
jgi:formylglycine-generating enzyme required for sulfatase activity